MEISLLRPIKQTGKRETAAIEFNVGIILAGCTVMEGKKPSCLTQLADRLEWLCDRRPPNPGRGACISSDDVLSLGPSELLCLCGAVPSVRRLSSTSRIIARQLPMRRGRADAELPPSVMKSSTARSSTAGIRIGHEIQVHTGRLSTVAGSRRPRLRGSKSHHSS